jgi:2-hydroxymuconate-semialdehyde hydrolase
MNSPLELRRAPVSGGHIAYVDAGEGPVALLLHGFPTSSFLWRREVPLLASRMRVIAPDLLGYGASEKSETADLSEMAQARYVRELVEGLGVSELAVVGHDIGGAIAQVLALDSKDVAVRAMVLLDSACFDAWPIDGVRRLQEVTPEQETRNFVEDVVRLTFDLGVAHRNRIDEGAMASYLEPWMNDPPAFFRAVRGIEGKGLVGRDLDLAALEAPAFIIWGEEDPFLPAELGERLQAALPGSTLALLPGCSHFVMEDAPRTIGPLVYEFLRSRYLSGVAT